MSYEDAGGARPATMDDGHRPSGDSRRDEEAVEVHIVDGGGFESVYGGGFECRCRLELLVKTIILGLVD